VTLIPAGAVLLTSGASIGFVAVAGRDVTTNQGLASFICSNEVYNFYMAYWLWASRGMLEVYANGTTFKEISKSTLRGIKIPIPPFAE
jgi:type I restriction enzyme S subunit